MTHPESFGAEHLLRARVEQREGHVEVSVAGELDLSGAEAFEDRLRSLATLVPGGMVIDLTELEFIDSAGLRSLIVLRRHMQEQGATLEIRNPRGAVARVLAMTGLAGEF